MLIYLLAPIFFPEVPWALIQDLTGMGSPTNLRCWEGYFCITYLFSLDTEAHRELTGNKLAWEKTADISRTPSLVFSPATWRLRNENRLMRYQLDLGSGSFCFLLVVPQGKFALTNQRPHPDQGIGTSSVWNFRARSSFPSFRAETSGGVAKSAVFPGSK